jgi:2-methylcitrate dehydratase
VESIRVGMPERGISHVTSITRPHDVISAQASLGYSVGVRLVKGSNSLEMYINPELWRDPDVLAVVDKLQPYAVVKESQPRYTKVEITLKNGKVLEGEQGHTRGSETLPFSDEIIENKFRSLAEVMLPKHRVEQILQTVARLEQVSSVSQLVAMLQKP